LPGRRRSALPGGRPPARTPFRAGILYRRRPQYPINQYTPCIPPSETNRHKPDSRPRPANPRQAGHGFTGMLMIQRSLSALAAVLLGFGVACGQTPGAPPVPFPPTLPEVVQSSAPTCGEPGRPAFPGEPDPGVRGIVTFDAEYLLWFLADSR